MITAGLVLGTTVVTLGLWTWDFTRIHELFRLNKQRQEEGFHMTEFEFQMVGAAYRLDKGRFVEAAVGIEELRHRLRTGEGLVKVPRFADAGREMDFYLDLQNPRTGAFMDDSQPYCTWEGPTGNVLLHLEELSRRTGRPLVLHHPLRFFDSIATPARLRAYLDDITRLGWLGTLLPESSFHIARDLLHYAADSSVVERNGLYRFSPEWKLALLTWMRENQDPETGFWGPRRRGTGKLTKKDLHNTGSIAAAFSDHEGRTIHPGLELRYKDRMLATTLEVMAEPPPPADELGLWHGWTLRENKGIALITRHLWDGVSDSDRTRARTAFERMVRLRFERLYSASEGAFAYYPLPGRATIDGTGSAIATLDDAGSWSPEKQRRIWGGPGRTCANLGERRLDRALSDSDLACLRAFPGLNSVRFYAREPDTGAFASGAAGAFYFARTTIPDLLEYGPGLKTWLDSSSQNLGNWVSRAETIERWSRARITPAPVHRGGVPLAVLDSVMAAGGRVVLVGFDAFQVPVCRMGLGRADAASDSAASAGRIARRD